MSSADLPERGTEREKERERERERDRERDRERKRKREGGRERLDLGAGHHRHSPHWRSHFRRPHAPPHLLARPLILLLWGRGRKRATPPQSGYVLHQRSLRAEAFGVRG